MTTKRLVPEKWINDVVASGLFDAQWYREQYPDVDALGMDPVEHYIAIGHHVNRDPSPRFSTRFYATKNPGVRNHNMVPLLHYIWHGAKEGRAVLPDADDQSNLVVDSEADGDHLRRPRRNKGDGRVFQSTSRNRDHFWYRDSSVLDIVFASDQSWRPRIRHLLVVAHDFMLSTGVTRPISHYLNVLCQSGHCEITSVEVSPTASMRAIQHDAAVNDFVIFNSLWLIENIADAIDVIKELGPRKCAVYLHETEWGFDKFRREQPEKYSLFQKYAPSFNFFCVSESQALMLRERFGALITNVVYNTTKVPATLPQRRAPKARSGRVIKIGMVGTLQPRKGATLFSKVADICADLEFPFEFVWAGWEASGEYYKSQNVRYVGSLDGFDLSWFYEDLDVLFLPSIDDPFPLACVEALSIGTRIVVYRKCGFAEVASQLKGCGVFDEHDAYDALSVILRVLSQEVDLESHRRVSSEFSLDTFVRRVSRAIDKSIGEESRHPVAPSESIVAIVHLFYPDLLTEICTYLASLPRTAHAIVSIPESASSDLEALVERTFASVVSEVTVFRVSNHGMDIWPFVLALDLLRAQGRTYDLIVKIHSKKSLAASGVAAGRRWRLDCFDSLLGSSGQVREIVGVFRDHLDVGMVGPRGMLMGQSSRDGDGNANNEFMVQAGSRLGITDFDLEFFRGSMFWARYKIIDEAFERAAFRIEEFEASHQIDGSLAHAVERLFGSVVRSKGFKLLQTSRSAVRSIELLKSRHAGEDIYVVLSGPTTGLIDPRFFEGKTVVGVNRVVEYIPCDYVVMKEFPGPSAIHKICDIGAKAVVSDWETGNIKRARQRKNADFFRDENVNFFGHSENVLEVEDLSAIGSARNLVVSASTATSALHFAAFLGARNIILVGHDCGLLDGSSSMEGYNFDLSKTPWSSAAEYAEWLGGIEGHSLVTRRAVEEFFDCRVYSLNPFLNIGLEGHQYSKTAQMVVHGVGQENE